MKRLIPNLLPIGAALLLVLMTTGALAASKTEKRMNSAVEVLKDFTSIPEQGIPPRILNDAYGVAVIPGVIKVGLTIGGRYGKGILTVRQEDGQWSNPTFISLGGGSFGLQIGAQSTDVILVFKDRSSVDRIVSGKLTLGADASAAAGPVGRSTSAATDHLLRAEIYSYSRSRGLFAGIALDGAWLGMDRKSNEEYYNNGMSPRQILDARNMPTPMAANQFIEMLTAAAPRVSGTSRMARATPAPQPAQPMPEQSQPEPMAQPETYAIEPIDGYYGDETTF